jgi:hypothetical protein
MTIKNNILYYDNDEDKCTDNGDVDIDDCEYEDEVNYVNCEGYEGRVKAVEH